MTITHRAFLCHRCYNNTPKGLNAPDPRLPNRRLDETDLLYEDKNENELPMDLFIKSARSKWKQPSAEFDLPDDLLQELRSALIVACNGLAPAPYVMLRRSLYLHNKTRDLLPVTDVFICSCDPLLGCDDNCQNRALQQECEMTTCPCRNFCSNRCFSTQPSDANHLTLFLTEKKGWGVKTNRFIQPGELVIEYVGEVIDKKTWEARKKKMTRYDHMYFMALNQSEIVDASRKGNLARFINHACDPNLQVEKWYVHRIPRLGLFAKTQIAEGEELSYNYSVKWFGNREFAQRCYCGALNCTGYLGRAPE